MASDVTNSDQNKPSNSGKPIAFVLLAIAAVLFVLGLLDDYEGGLAIHPMDQFVISPLFGDTLNWYTPTNSTLWMALCVMLQKRSLYRRLIGRMIVKSAMGRVQCLQRCF